MSAEKYIDYNNIGNIFGQIEFEHIDRYNNKQAVMIRRIFPDPAFRRSQYIGLQMTGKLNGSINVSAPACYNVRCGEKPVNGFAGITYAENGDLILFAPRGRIRIVARDIDLIAEGNGDNTGFVNIHSNAVIDINTNELRAETSDSISMGAERKIDINSMQKIGLNAANVKVVESADVTLIGSGSNTPIQTYEGYKKLIESLLGS